MPDGFLRSWVAVNVRPVMAAERSKEAARLAAYCTAEAVATGIAPDALKAAAGGDLVQYMGEAIDNATRAEVDKMLERVRPKDAPRTKGPEETS